MLCARLRTKFTLDTAVIRAWSLPSGGFLKTPFSADLVNFIKIIMSLVVEKTERCERLWVSNTESPRDLLKVNVNCSLSLAVF